MKHSKRQINFAITDEEEEEVEALRIPRCVFYWLQVGSCTRAADLSHVGILVTLTRTCLFIWYFLALHTWHSARVGRGGVRMKQVLHINEVVVLVYFGC